jgi:hypothetical protein
MPPDQQSPQQLGPLTPHDPSEDPDYDPRDFTVKGDGSEVTAWKDLTLHVGSKLCEGPYCELTDALDVRVKITMSSKQPRLTWTSFYSPNNYYYNEKHLEFFAISDNQIVSLPNQNTSPFGEGGFGAYFLNNGDYAGKDLTIAVRLWAKNADDDYQTVGARTAKAQCDPPDPNAPTVGVSCRF